MEITWSELSSTEKQQLINMRVGQGLFRDRVAKAWVGEFCAVTFVGVRQMLIESHKRTWRDCRYSAN